MPVMLLRLKIKPKQLQMHSSIKGVAGALYTRSVAVLKSYIVFSGPRRRHAKAIRRRADTPPSFEQGRA